MVMRPRPLDPFCLRSLLEWKCNQTRTCMISSDAICNTEITRESIYHCQHLSESAPKCLLVTVLVPSDMACLDSSPGRISRTAVCISRDAMVDFLLYRHSPMMQSLITLAFHGKSTDLLAASVAIRSNISLNTFVSPWRCYDLNSFQRT